MKVCTVENSVQRLNIGQGNERSSFCRDSLPRDPKCFLCCDVKHSSPIWWSCSNVFLSVHPYSKAVNVCKSLHKVRSDDGNVTSVLEELISVYSGTAKRQ